MIFRPRPPIRRSGDGFSLSISSEERQVIGSMLQELADFLDEDDPALRRLKPTAYLEDPDKDAEYQLLAGSELNDRRRASIDQVLATLESDHLDEDQMQAWLTSINAVRLVIGTRLDVAEDDDLDVDPEHPDAPMHAAYGYLGWLLENTIAALTS